MSLLNLPESSNRGRIGQEYYDSEYFQRGAHLTDPNSRFHQYRVRNVLELLAPSPGDRVVDLGCGWGTVTFALADRVTEAIGVDYSEKSVALCNQRLGREPHANLRFLHADARATGLPAGAFDAVVAADLYEHLYPEDAKVVTYEAFRLLRKGGRFAIWTPHRGHALEILKNNGILLKPDPSHVDYKSMETLTGQLSDAGFSVSRSFYAPSHLRVFSLLERAFGPLVPALRRRICVLGVKPQ